MVNLLDKTFIINRNIATNVTETHNNTSHFKETAAVIPIVIAPKYTESSNGDLTGFLKRTIDKAPTIPRDKAKSPAITLVIVKLIIGSKKIDAV